jgi:heme/copper-type cytochrome/quinol oxidase subunit 2
VVVRPNPELLELAAPRLDRSRGGKLAASSATTGVIVHPEPPQRLSALRLVRPHPAVAERPLWQLIAITYTGVSLVVLLVIALVFLVSWLAAGAPY